MKVTTVHDALVSVEKMRSLPISLWSLALSFSLSLTHTQARTHMHARMYFFSFASRTVFFFICLDLAGAFFAVSGMMSGYVWREKQTKSRRTVGVEPHSKTKEGRQEEKEGRREGEGKQNRENKR